MNNIWIKSLDETIIINISNITEEILTSISNTIYPDKFCIISCNNDKLNLDNEYIIEQFIARIPNCMKLYIYSKNIKILSLETLTECISLTIAASNMSKLVLPPNIITYPLACKTFYYFDCPNNILEDLQSRYPNVKISDSIKSII